MTDQTDKRFKVISALLVGLLVAVVVQSMVIYGMHRRLTAGEDAGASITQRDHNQPRPQALAPAKQADEDKDPFAWERETWDPFAEMHSMQDRINQMFGSAFNRFQQSDDFAALFRVHPFAPAVNIEDKQDQYVVTVDLPGSEDSKLDVKLEGQTLTISGSVQSESTETDKGKMLREERRSGTFQRIVTLPGPVKADKMNATTRKGVLTITIPKATE